MYAITATGYRAITRAEDAQAGETVVLVLPALVQRVARGMMARGRRNRILRNSDWTQVTDAPITAAQRTQWATYRQALRDLPNAPGFPDTVTWPQEPGLPDGAASVPIR